MSQSVVRFERVGKKFCRTTKASILHGLADLTRRLFRRPRFKGLRSNEFWAVDALSFEVSAGECLGIIGPNGAGKSTLLKLINRDYRLDTGRISLTRDVTSLIRLGTGLQPMLTGRENIYIKCTELGLTQFEIDALYDSMVDFSGLSASIDLPVKQYSDGMYARLEFSIATCVPCDLLLIDEVLSVGDIGFQMRCLRRLEAFKRQGTTILFVSHSEMNVRQIADRCLLLFEGKAIAVGLSDAVFSRYYELIGFSNQLIAPDGLLSEYPETLEGAVTVHALSAHVDGHERSHVDCSVGDPLTLWVRYDHKVANTLSSLVIQFWSPTGYLIASFDSSIGSQQVQLCPEIKGLRIEFPFLGLAPGIYHLAAGFRVDQKWFGYSRELMTLSVKQNDLHVRQGLYLLPGTLRTHEEIPRNLPAD